MTTTSPDTDAAAVSPATTSGSTSSFPTHGLRVMPCSWPRRSYDASTHRRRLGCRHDASQAQWRTRGARKTHRRGATTANRSFHHPRTSGAGTPAPACANRCALGCAFAHRHSSSTQRRSRSWPRPRPPTLSLSPRHRSSEPTPTIRQQRQPLMAAPIPASCVPTGLATTQLHGHHGPPSRHQPTSPSPKWCNHRSRDVPQRRPHDPYHVHSHPTTHRTHPAHSHPTQPAPRTQVAPPAAPFSASVVARAPPRAYPRRQIRLPRASLACSHARAWQRRTPEPKPCSASPSYCRQ